MTNQNARQVSLAQANGGSEAHEASSRRALWARAVLPPLVLFVLARLRLDRSAVFAGADPYSFGSWSRWDSAHYLSIVKRGYEFFSCARVPGYDPSLWCGNTGWLPGLPYLMKLLSVFGIAPLTSGVLIAQFCAFGGLVVLWNCVLSRELSIKSLLALGLAAFFPGQVYQHALFPVSLCLLFQMLAMYACSERKFAWAGVFGAFGAFTYSSGVFLAAVLGMHLLTTERRAPWPQQVRQWLLTSGTTTLGFAAFHGLLWIVTDVWDAYFKVQAKYGFKPTWPWETLSKHMYGLKSGSVQSMQSICVAVLASLLLWGALRGPRRAVDSLLAWFLIVYWLVPLALGGELSLYRAEAMLLPAAPLAKHLPLPVAIPVVVAAVYLSARMSLLFFRNVLV